MDILPENNVEKFPGPLPGEEHHILIPDATYTASHYGYQGFYFMGQSPRVASWFKIHDAVGDESLIAAMYAVKQISKSGEKIKDRARNPEFLAGWKSRIVRDIATLFPARFTPHNLPTAMPLIAGPVVIKTTTVKTDPEHILRPEAFWWSKIHYIVGWANAPSKNQGMDKNQDMDIHLDNNRDSSTDTDIYTLDEYMREDSA